MSVILNMKVVCALETLLVLIQLLLVGTFGAIWNKADTLCVKLICTFVLKN